MACHSLFGDEPALGPGLGVSSHHCAGSYVLKQTQAKSGKVPHIQK